MSTNVSLIRDHNGIPHLAVAGHYATGARVVALSPNGEGELVAVIHIPTRHLTFEEQTNVVRFDRVQRDAA